MSRMDHRLFVQTVLLVMILILFSVSTSYTSVLERGEEREVSIPGYVLECYDPLGLGFADRPGQRSTLESTLTALELLDNTRNEGWPVGLHRAVESAITHLVSMQSRSSGGFASKTGTGPDLHTTMMVVKTLRAADALHRIDMDLLVDHYLR